MIPIQSNPKHQACPPKIRESSSSHLYPKFPTPTLSIERQISIPPKPHLIPYHHEFLLDPPPSGLTSPPTPLLPAPATPESCLSTPVLDTVGVIPLHPASEFG